jgi:hypothetical protein
MIKNIALKLFLRNGGLITVEMEWRVVTYCVIAFIVLIVILVIYQLEYQNNLGKDYVLTSNGQIVVNVGNMSLSIDNSHKNSSRIIEIDGVSNIAKARIYSSILRTSSGSSIAPKTTPLPISESSESVMFTPDKELTQPGSYDGWLSIRGHGSQFIIPINMSSPPMLVQALTIVLLGCVSSIIFWDVIHYYGRKNAQTKNRIIEEKADEIYREVDNEPDQMKKNSLLTRATFLKEQRDSKRFKEKSVYDTKAGTAKVTFTAAASSAFAIFVALLGLLNNEYLMGITLLNYQDIGVLFGLGFGATSLKELMVKSND